MFVHLNGILIFQSSHIILETAIFLNNCDEITKLSSSYFKSPSCVCGLKLVLLTGSA